MAETLSSGLPKSVEDLVDRVLDRAHQRELKLATAESCTGGLLAALLTDVPGRGHVFERGFVAYSVPAKCDLLGLDRSMVETCGAVSRPVAEAMAQGALRRSEADIALAITGFAGPGDEDEEEGLVFLACARRGGRTDHREAHFGSIGRQGVRIAALEAALEMIEASIDDDHLAIGIL